LSASPWSREVRQTGCAICFASSVLPCSERKVASAPRAPNSNSVPKSSEWALAPERDTDLHVSKCCQKRKLIVSRFGTWQFHIAMGTSGSRLWFRELISAVHGSARVTGRACAGSETASPRVRKSYIPSPVGWAFWGFSSVSCWLIRYHPSSPASRHH
jgi:hypothetical protein